jgi:hypothetical protein
MAGSVVAGVDWRDVGDLVMDLDVFGVRAVWMRCRLGVKAEVVAEYVRARREAA